MGTGVPLPSTLVSSLLNLLRGFCGLAFVGVPLPWGEFWPLKPLNPPTTSSSAPVLPKPLTSSSSSLLKIWQTFSNTLTRTLRNGHARNSAHNNHTSRNTASLHLQGNPCLGNTRRYQLFCPTHWAEWVDLPRFPRHSRVRLRN